MEWDRTVLEYVGDYADYISLHRYVGNRNSDTADYLAITNSIDEQIEVMDALCRYVQAKARRQKRPYLCFDEWNVWYRTENVDQLDALWKTAQHVGEEEYNLEDALVVAGFLNSFIRHADVVKIANLAQIVNNLAPILTRGEQLLRQSIYYTFRLYAGRRAGVALRASVNGPGYESPSYGFVHTIDTSAILGDGLLHLFLVNRSLNETATVALDNPGLDLTAVQSAEVVTGPAAGTQNTFEQPHQVTSQPFTAIDLQAGQAVFQLPPLSVAGVTFGCLCH
jgi:alpha-N-arabinofuranosidase